MSNIILGSNGEEQEIIKLGVMMNKSGGIVIPHEIREEIGLESGDIFDLDYNRSTRTITLNRIAGRCILTGKTTNLVNINGVYMNVEALSEVIEQLGAEGIIDKLIRETEVGSSVSRKAIVKKNAEELEDIREELLNERNVRRDTEEFIEEERRELNVLRSKQEEQAKIIREKIALLKKLEKQGDIERDIELQETGIFLGKKLINDIGSIIDSGKVDTTEIITDGDKNELKVLETRQFIKYIPKVANIRSKSKKKINTEDGNVQLKFEEVIKEEPKEKKKETKKKVTKKEVEPKVKKETKKEETKKEVEPKVKKETKKKETKKEVEPKEKKETKKK